MAGGREILIVGNGITGVTAARHLRKRGDDRITIISAETDHPYSRPALMYVFMGDLRYEDTKLYEDGFWEKNRITLRRDWVEAIETSAQRMRMRSGGELAYDALILATGSSAARFDWPGQDLRGVQSLCAYQDLENLERNMPGASRAVIVGGGLIGIELAEMLVTRGIKVTMLIREKDYWSSALPEEEARLVTRHAREHGIELQLETELREIVGDSEGRARAVVTTRGETLPCEVVGLTVGVRPNIALAKESGIECARGILVDAFFRTSAENVYAGGDCAQHRTPPPSRKAVEQVWYTGKMHGEAIAANLSGEQQPYRPGVWFNSAKFFDIEYQTYGEVPNRAPEGVESFFWEAAAGRKSMRINFQAKTGAVTGVNVFGLRQRQAVWERWIAAETSIKEVMAHLGAANFDPEFFQQAEPEIIGAFNRRYPALSVQLRSRRGLLSRYLRRMPGPGRGAPLAESP